MPNLQEMRYNPFWDQWVVIASNTGNRPWNGDRLDQVTLETPHFVQDCYLCPGNSRVSGGVNPDYQEPWFFANDFSCMPSDAPLMPAREVGPYRVASSRGHCEVIVYHRDHSQRLSTMDVRDIRQVIDIIAQRYEELGALDDVKYVFFFENRGKVMGNSQPHPHGQIYAYPMIPSRMAGHQTERCNREQQGGKCFVCDANSFEIEQKDRVLSLTDHFVAYVPYAALFPFDIVIAPRAHKSSLVQLDSGERDNLASILKQVTSGLDNMFSVPHQYTMGMIQAPTDGIDRGWHMQIHLTSFLRNPIVLKYEVGPDRFCQMTNPSSPEGIAVLISAGIAKIPR